MLQKLKTTFVFTFLATCLVLSLALAGIYSYTKLHLTQPISLTEKILVHIKPGQNLRQFVDLLAEQSLIDYPLVWYAYLKLFAQNFTLKYGEYHMQPGMHLAELLRKINEVEVVYYKFTLLEGTNLRQILLALSQANLIHRLEGNYQTKLAQLQDFLKLENPEGWFFADTYYYHRYMEDLVLLKTAHQKMQRVLAKVWTKRKPNLPLDTPYKALILASIIEKESALPDERKIIAGVFINRLNKSMRLQSDPTVIYGLGKKFTGNLTRADLRQSTAYNTYRIAGLPPTPIAAVGQEALLAAVQPEQTSAFYFVSRGDGSHYFSATLREHNAAVRRYQLKR